MVEQMTIEPLAAENFGRWFSEARDMVREHAERRVRKTSLVWLASLTPETLKPGQVLIAHDGQNVLGASVATEAGGPNFTVIRPEVRRQGIARALIAAKLKLHARYETLVALDNVPSILLMLDAGMVAVEGVDNGNGKTVLRFALPSRFPTEAEAQTETDATQKNETERDSLMELIEAKSALIDTQTNEIAALKRAPSSWLVRLARWITGE